MNSLQTLMDDVHAICCQLKEVLTHHRSQLVLAESCSGGLAAASLTAVPGISEVFCGSLVTYQTHTKTLWLDVPTSTIHSFDVVSQEVADQMAYGALIKTPTATWSASITGHLGPSDDPRLGQAFLAVAYRPKSDGAVDVVQRIAHQFHSYPDHERRSRQWEAVLIMLTTVVNTVKKQSIPSSLT